MPFLSCDSNVSRKETIDISRLGTSIPINDFPGMGASIRISLAANARAKSSLKLTILLTFTPIAGCNSYSVTDGPKLTFLTSASTPKLFKVFCKISIFLSIALISLV